MLKELLMVLEETEEDINCTQPPENTSLHKLMDAEQIVFTEEDAQEFIQEFQQTWPEVTGLSTNGIMILKDGLSGGAVELEYRLLRGFVAEGVHAIESFEADGDRVSLVNGLVSTVQRVLGPPSSRISITSIPAAHEATLLLAIRDKLKEISAAAKAFDSKLKGAFGDVPTSRTDK